MGRKVNRAPSGAGMIRQRKDGSWEGRVTVGYDDDGRRIRKSIYGKTQEEVRKTVSELNVSIDNKTYSEPSKMKLSEWLDIWQEEYLNSIKETTATVYRNTVRTYLKPNLGKTTISKLSPHQIQHFYNRLLERGLSPKTIFNIHGVLHKALDQAMKIGYISSNPSSACDLPKRSPFAFHALDKEQISQFFDAIKGDYYECFFKICLFTGLRISEAVGLTWDCINIRDGSIRVYRQMLYKEQKFGPLKNEKPRTIVPAPFVMSLLNGVKVQQINSQRKAGALWSNPDGFVFAREDGSHFKQNHITKHFRKAIEKAELPKMRFHDLRHSFAVLSIQAGDDFKTISENMGHHSVAFTMDTYAKVTDNMKKASANRMQSLIESI